MEPDLRRPSMTATPCRLKRIAPKPVAAMRRTHFQTLTFLVPSGSPAGIWTITYLQMKVLLKPWVVHIHVCILGGTLVDSSRSNLSQKIVIRTFPC